MNLLKTSAAAMLLLLAGCTSSSRIAELESELARNSQRVQTLEQDLSDAQSSADEAAARAEENEAALAAARAEAEEARASAATPPVVMAGAGGGSIDLLPADATPGMCYARLYIPPQLRTVTERVLVREAGERIETIPAEYGTRQERVLVREAGEEIAEVKPAVYEWREERIEVRPASYRLEEVPAVYETETERILVKQARQVWKPSEGRIYGAALNRDSAEQIMRDQNGNFITRIDTGSGQMMCLVEEPAEYQTVTRRVLKSPATTRRVEIPAEFETVRRQVMVKPPEVIKREVPARYETRTIRTVVREAGERRIAIPAEYGEVTKTEVVSEGTAEWLPVLCDVNVTTAKVREIQSALKRAGHYPGPIDGIYGRQTVTGVDSYQRANQLATGGLTLETLDSLNVAY